ncbi:3-phenylpropionate/cinnamic acid dioxygenase ferredoxin--NAD(+) reductase subunit [Acidocella sp. KAb 2-4]|uniref:3-phenylpropionate/cinnamic acid dioxygenase ferredoxin--NAD(+) reductase subunit n=1 Tax=Acidocella sp. KAb 2-4 TaxID=2885158 RepID=UPI001D08A8A7|nr:3-phenylpropionate/cinnamic acid dioxygenase ferredoxin--NAD(+) reductase subunit [Acidocella sp. KAb 2-4]MCB5944228.1 FAD-dependent oxidoreductase [Acidocella sp. KAb 2-4]
MSAPVYIVVGAGHAAAAAVAAMRGAGFAGRIILIGDEPHVPYERPPLSKDVLLSPGTGPRPIYPADYYATHDIETRFGALVERIEPAARRLVLADGETLVYDKLLLATGARARRYPLLDALGEGVHVLRTLEDGQGLQKELLPGRHLLVVGGGIIGLEVAASAAKLGVAVTVLERAPRLMTRGVPLPLVNILRALHEQQGVSFELSVELTEATRGPNGQFHLRAADGRTFAGASILYGVGVEINDRLTREAGLALDNGVLVDELCRTSVPEIFAAGDIARQFQPFLGEAVRQETWANAVHQGTLAGRVMATGEGVAFEVPWYWTDQYGINFQVAGKYEADEWLARGDPASGKYMLFGLTGGRVTGAVTVNNGRDMKLAKLMIAAGASPDPALLCDTAHELRKLKLG